MRSSRPLPFPIQNQTDAEFAQWYHRDPIFNEHDYSAQNKSIHAVLVQRGSLPNNPPPLRRGWRKLPQTLDIEPRPTWRLAGVGAGLGVLQKSKKHQGVLVRRKRPELVVRTTTVIPTAAPISLVSQNYEQQRMWPCCLQP